MKAVNVAIAGATGAVGEALLEILEQRDFPIDRLHLLASERSVGKRLQFRGRTLKVEALDDFDFSDVQIGLFSAGGSRSAEHAPRAAAAGCVVIDNTSHFRYEADIPLLVPEVNLHRLNDYRNRNIIANPNCSTIQMVMALAPLHRSYKIKRIVVSTYQSVTGTGVKAMQQLDDETNGRVAEMVYKYPIHRNVIPQCDVFLDNRYTKEEMKLVHETKKILRDDSIQVTATAVRVPVKGGHSESVNVAFEKPFELQDILRTLATSPGLLLLDNPDAFEYPMPLIAEGKDDVFVGRVRRDESIANGLNLWIVADNLRKGAATNAVQIAELISKIKK